MILVAFSSIAEDKKPNNKTGKAKSARAPSASKTECASLLSTDNALLAFARKKNWPRYTFENLNSKWVPSMSALRADYPDYVKGVVENTIAMVTRPEMYHSYIRVGRLIFDIDVRSFNTRQDRITVLPRARDYADMLEKSKNTAWTEVVLNLNPDDIKTIQWYFMYRIAHYYEIKEDRLLDTPWNRKFKEEDVTDDHLFENCVGAALSPFLPAYLDDGRYPTGEAAEKLREIASKISADYPYLEGISGQAPPLEDLIVKLRKISQKTNLGIFSQLELISSRGTMRLAASFANGLLGFVRHNLPQRVHSAFILNNVTYFPEETPSLGRPIDADLDNEPNKRLPLN
jgi:hypothetical protein